MKYRLLEPAQRELQAAIDYYEHESPGLGGRFLDEFELTLERVLQYPQAWARISENHCRCRTRRFPYGVIYFVEGDVVVISALMHLHRHPDAWKKP
jgi:plasmid stabilization system protein ParE